METPSCSFVDDLSASPKDLASDSAKNSKVVTWKPFTPEVSPSNPLPQRNRRNRRNHPRYVGNDQVEILPGLFEPDSYSRYITLKFDDKRVEDSDIFKICREVTALCGREPKMSFENDGSLLIEVTSPEESEKVQSLELINGIKASCTPHKSMNSCRGVIRSPYLMKYSEERLQEEFESQKVVNVKQMMKKIDGVLTPIPTYVLTFNMTKLPLVLKAAWLRLEVRPYIPSPRRCYYCQRFGHVSDSCRRKIKGDKRICNNCGQEDHGDCNKPSFCINCTGNHPASSKSCDRYILEREIQTIRSKEHVTFQEAKKRVMTHFIRPGVSFASVIDKGRRISVPAKSESSHLVENNASLKNKTSISDTNKISIPNAKRRRSFEEQDSLPFCKSNRFDVLSDEMEFYAMDNETTKVDDNLDAVSQDITPDLARTVVQAELHTSACSAERAESPASAGFWEPAGAKSLVDDVSAEAESSVGPVESAGAKSSVVSVESAGEETAVGSVESAGGGSPDGLGESSGAVSLAVLGESVGSSSPADSPEQVGDLKVDSNKNIKREKNEKGAVSNTNKTTAHISGSRKIKVPNTNSGTPKPKNKNENKNVTGGSSGKASSKSKK